MYLCVLCTHFLLFIFKFIDGSDTEKVIDTNIQDQNDCKCNY